MAVHGLARDAVWSYAALLAASAASFVVIALGFRELTDTEMGAYSIATATATLMAVVDPAIGLSISRAVARLEAGIGDARRERSLIADAHAVLAWAGGMLVVAGGALGLIAHLTRWFTPGAPTWTMLALVGLSCAVQIATAALPAVLTGHSDYFSQARAGLLYAVALVAVTSALLPLAGVVALGIAQASAVGVSRLSLVPQVRRWEHGDLAAIPAQPTRYGTGQLLRVTGPMLVLALTGQVMAWIDVVVVGAFAGAAAAALFRVGSILPSQVVSLIYRGFDVAFPRLSSGLGQWQLGAVAILTRVFSAASAVVFAGLIVMRSDVVSVLTGGSSHLAETVVVVCAVTWAVNVPTHGIGLLAIARDLQAVLTPVVLSEGVANALLTVVLVATWQPEGAAWATLVTLGISNLVVVPLVLRRRIPGSARILIVDGMVPLLAVGIPAGALLELQSRFVDGEGPRVALLLVTGIIITLVATWTTAGEPGRRAIRLSLKRRRPVI